MKVYDQQGNLLEEYDLNLGRLVESTRTVHHPAVEGVEEVWHWETLREYPNGGRDVKKVIEVKGRQAQPAWVEEVPVSLFIPYTQEELKAIQAERNRPTLEERLEKLEQLLERLFGKEVL